MNITDTMTAIRFMMEKHLGKYESRMDSPIAIRAKERKEHKKGKSPGVEFVLDAIKRHEMGTTIKEIGRQMDSTETTIGNIINRRKAFKEMPFEEQQIRAWFYKKDNKRKTK